MRVYGLATVNFATLALECNAAASMRAVIASVACDVYYNLNHPENAISATINTIKDNHKRFYREIKIKFESDRLFIVSLTCSG